MMKYVSVIFLITMLWSQVSMAACSYVPIEQLRISVQSCQLIEPRNHPKFDYYFGYITNSRQAKRFESSYTGALISTASTTYFRRDSSLSTCDTLNRDDLINVSVGTACCDGDPNAPCVLGTSKYITQLELVQQ